MFRILKHIHYPNLTTTVKNLGLVLGFTLLLTGVIFILDALFNLRLFQLIAK